MTLTRRYRFSASHRLHSPQLTERENDRVYGKCNNPFGHGHDYIVEVSVSGPLDVATGRIVDLQTMDRLVREEVLDPFEHHNLNEDIPAFSDVVPTTENLAIEIGRRLGGAWAQAFKGRDTQLHKITIRETRNNTFELRL